jgi:hypothetical protein
LRSWLVSALRISFFDKAAGTVKSYEAGSKITLKKGISFPDNGEGFIMPSMERSRNEK